MFQTLVLVATLVVLSAAVLTSSLVTAKSAFHALVVAKTQTAMNDATADFVAWAQKVVATNGTEADWTAATAQQAPTLRAMCADGAPKCAFAETEQWTVTGATAGKTQPQQASTATDASAINMAPAVDEQRISATISVSVSDASGRTSYGGKTEQVTARIFDAAPYVVITATHDLSAAVGLLKSVEGDSGGVLAINAGNAALVPSESQPSAYTNTVVETTVDCVNTVGFDAANPMAAPDNGASLIDSRYRRGGLLIWAYQIPCAPANGVPPAPVGTENYEPPAGMAYKIEASDVNTSWQKGNSGLSSFAR